MVQLAMQGRVYEWGRVYVTAQSTKAEKWTFALSGPVGTATACALREEFQKLFFLGHPLVAGIQKQQ